MPDTNAVTGHQIEINLDFVFQTIMDDLATHHNDIIVSSNVIGPVFKTVLLSRINKIPRLVYLAYLIPAIILEV